MISLLLNLNENIFLIENLSENYGIIKYKK